MKQRIIPQQPSLQTLALPYTNDYKKEEIQGQSSYPNYCKKEETNGSIITGIIPQQLSLQTLALPCTNVFKKEEIQEQLLMKSWLKNGPICIISDWTTLELLEWTREFYIWSNHRLKIENTANSLGASLSGDLSLEDQVSKWPWEGLKRPAGAKIASLGVMWGSQDQETRLTLDLNLEFQMDKKVWIMSQMHSSKLHAPATTSSSSLQYPLIPLNSCLCHLAILKMPS